MTASQHPRDHAAPSPKTFERPIPAEWPPQRGDLWRDSYPRGGHRPRPFELWFAIDSVIDGIRFVGSTGHKEDPGRVRSAYGPLTLVHREDGQGGTS